MHIKEYHRRYNIDRKHKALKAVSLKHFARFAAQFGGEEGIEARRWMQAKSTNA